MAALGMFSLTIDGDRFGGQEETTAQVSIRAQNSGGYVNDPDADKFHFQPETFNKVALPFTITSLPTDVTSGISTTIGYTVTVRTKGGSALVVDLAAQPAGSTVSLSDVTPVVLEPIGDATAAATRAEAAATDAETAAAAAQAVGTTNDTVIASRINDTTSATSAALSASYAAIFTPEAKGAVGDGTTDDTAAIQQAIAAAQAFASRGVVRFADGKTYIVSAALDFAGVRVEGEGATLKIKNGTTPTYSVIDLTAACVIDGLTIDLNKANTTDPGNQLQGNGLLMNAAAWDGLVVRNVTIRNGHQVGVQIYGPGAADADSVPYCRTVLDTVTVEACKVASFSVKTVQGVTITGCRSTNSGGASFYLSLVGRSVVSDCEATGGAGAGFFLEYCQDVKVANNLAESNAVQGIAIGGGSDTLRENRNITVVGNICRNNGSIGITVDPTKAGAPQDWVAVYSTVSNNLCEGNGAAGINLEHAGHVAASGNVCHGNAGTGLRILGAYVNASGNVLTGNTQYGMAVYGISGHDFGHHRFGGNTAVGNTAGNLDLTDISAGTVVDVLTRIPGSLRAQSTVNAAMDTAQETIIGATGPGGQAGISIGTEKLYRESTGILRTPAWVRSEGHLQAGYNGSGGYAAGHLTVGAYHLWVDTTGRLRIKSTTPTSDTDGTVVGTQA